MLEIGAIVEGKITGLTKFGAFVALPEGKSGLIHISEVANSYVTEVSEHLQNGQAVKVKIIGIERDGKINLSIKQTLERPQAPARPQTTVHASPRPGARSPAAPASFEDKLKQFMQDSDQKNSGNRLYTPDSKRGGSKRRK